MRGMKRGLIVLSLVSLGLLSLASAHAQNGEQNEGQTLRQDSDQEGYDILRHFGVGLSLTHDPGGSDRVDDAEIVNGIVRINRDSNTRARVMLEWHSWMFCEHLEEREVVDDGTHRSIEITKGEGDNIKKYWKQEPPCLPTRRSSGAFVAVQPGSDSVIDAIGLGWMFRFPDKLQMLGNRTLNIGFGLIADQGVRVLGDGFVENTAPPTSPTGTPETQVRYRTTSQSGIFAMASIELGQTPVQVPRRTLTFYAESPPNKRNPVVNDSVTLYWGIDGMDKCDASDGWMGEKKIRGQEQIKLESAGTKRFTLTCTSANGSASRFVEVTVVEPPAAAQN